MGIHHSPHTQLPIPHPYLWEAPYPRQPWFPVTDSYGL